MPLANSISPTYGGPGVAYLRGVIDSNNPFNLIVGGANWGDSMLTPEQRAIWEADVRAGRGDTYKDTKNEGGSANDSDRFVLSNIIGGYTPTNNGATDGYDWKNYGTFDDTVAKAKRHIDKGDYGTAAKNFLEFVAPYVMTAETGRSKANHADGTAVEGFTPEEVDRINGWWQSTPHSELTVDE